MPASHGAGDPQGGRLGPEEPPRAAATAPPRGDTALVTLTARILAFGRSGYGERAEYANIASAIGLAQYVAIAAEVAEAVGRGRVLDWGAGWGQNAALLSAHGLSVVAYDVEDKGAARGLLAETDVAYVVRPGPALPFDDGAFDAALNCGVLEHVDEPDRALAELRRVLAPGGHLFTYHLPNRHAWTEWFGRCLGRFHHDRTYTQAEALRLFEAAGFRVTACRPFHLLPRNVWARAPALAARLPGTFDAFDAGLLRVPGLRRLATAWTLIAVRD